MALHVNTTERLSYEEVARRLASIGQPKLATAVRQLGHQADDTASKYMSLLSEYTRLANSVSEWKPTPGERVSYKPGPMSDG
jgi:hypothetical protein